MANDINKKITIEVEAQTEKLEQNINNLNKTIGTLLEQQKSLTETGKENSKTFEDNASKIDAFQKSLKDAVTQLTAYNTTLNTAAGTLQKEQALVKTLTDIKDKYSKTVGDNSKKVKELDSLIKGLNTSIQQQQAQVAQSKNALDASTQSMAASAKQAAGLESSISDANKALQTQKGDVDKNKTAFDGHKKTMDLLKTSFDEVKDVSGIFGPSLSEAAKGFGVMKSGLSFVKDGLTGVGDAIKADGFDFLLQVLQMMFDYFIKTSKGSKILHGAISAIGVVVNKVKDFLQGFMSVMINAFSHPVETLKKLGRMIEEHLINQFKAVSVIIDGIIHLDFKKIANGAIQAVSGVTDATDKMANAYNTVKSAVKDTAGEMVSAFKDGYDKTESNLDQSLTNQYNKHQDHVKKVHQLYANDNEQFPRGQTIDAQLRSAGVSSTSSQDALSPKQVESKNLLANTKDTEDKKLQIKKTALQKFEDYAKKNAVKAATGALNILSKSIQAQSDAKVQALEKDKARELSNSNLTSAQKAAIEAKYKKKEGAIKAKAFKQQQEISIAQAIINGAIAITKSEADLGPIAGTIAIAAVVAETALQVATIAKQKPPAYAKGGLHYQSDGRGGVLSGYSRSDNTNAYLRSGEGIVVSEAMQVPWARNLVSAINVGFGGRDFSAPVSTRGFAVGGIFTDGGNANRYYNQPVNDQKNLANTVAYQMINNFPPVYVDVKDVNNQQNILAQTVNRVNL